MGISKIIQLVNDFQVETHSKRNDLYFRGQRSNDKLIPRLLRETLRINLKENYLYCNSWVMSNQDFIDCRTSWEILAKMQHFGIPTRLLDWTSSLITALYFAIADCVDCKQKNCFNDPKKINSLCDKRGLPVLWILNPREMHKYIYEGAINLLAFTIGIDLLEDYKDTFVSDRMPYSDWPYKKGPIFLEIPWTNNRVSTQKGYFTFHSDYFNRGENNIKNIVPLEDQLENSKALIKIELPPALINELMEEFKIMGISEFDIFPDLGSIGRFTERNLNL
jgi:hypothetical protein